MKTYMRILGGDANGTRSLNYMQVGTPYRRKSWMHHFYSEYQHSTFSDVGAWRTWLVGPKNDQCENSAKLKPINFLYQVHCNKRSLLMVIHLHTRNKKGSVQWCNGSIENHIWPVIADDGNQTRSLKLWQYPNCSNGLRAGVFLARRVFQHLQSLAFNHSPDSSKSKISASFSLFVSLVLLKVLLQYNVGTTVKISWNLKHQRCLCENILLISNTFFTFVQLSRCFLRMT